MNLDLLANWEYLPPNYTQTICDAAGKACSDGAVPPVTYIGMGAQGVVLCDYRAAFKVARNESDFGVQSMREEFEFLDAASQEPSIAQHIAKPFALHVNPLMIERECVEAREYRSSTKQRDDRRWDTFCRIMKLMNNRGWCCVEYKEDALVLHPKRGWVLVDGGFAHRMGWGLARHVRDVIMGKKPLVVDEWSSEGFIASTYAHQLRMDQMDGLLPKDVVQKLSAQLRSRWPWEGD